MKVFDVTISGHKGTKYHKGVLLDDLKESVDKLKAMLTASFSYPDDKFIGIVIDRAFRDVISEVSE